MRLLLVHVSINLQLMATVRYLHLIITVFRSTINLKVDPLPSKKPHVLCTSFFPNPNGLKMISRVWQRHPTLLQRGVVNTGYRIK